MMYMLFLLFMLCLAASVNSKVHHLNINISLILNNLECAVEFVQKLGNYESN